MAVEKGRDARWGSEDQSFVLFTATIGGAEHPCCAYVGDPLFDRAANGEFGEIAPYAIPQLDKEKLNDIATRRRLEIESYGAVVNVSGPNEPVKNVKIWVDARSRADLQGFTQSLQIMSGAASAANEPAPTSQWFVGGVGTVLSHQEASRLFVGATSYVEASYARLSDCLNQIAAGEIRTEAQVVAAMPKPADAAA